MAIDSFHLACAICSLLYFIVSVLLIWRERYSTAPPSQLLYVLPRVILAGSFFFCIESTSLVALSLLDITSSPYYEHLFTIISDAAGDVIILTGDFGIAVLCYVIASSAAVAADIVLDQNRMDWIRRVFAYWFAFGVVACAASCIARPLTNREAMGLIFYLNNFIFRSVGFVIIITQTIKLYIHVRDSGESGKVVRARLLHFFRLISLGGSAFAFIYFQGVRRCILLFEGLGTLPYFARTRPFDLSAVGKLILMSVTLLFVSRVTVCASFEAPVDDRRYSQLNDEKLSLRLRSDLHPSSDSVSGSVVE